MDYFIILYWLALFFRRTTDWHIVFVRTGEEVRRCQGLLLKSDSKCIQEFKGYDLKICYLYRNQGRESSKGSMILLQLTRMEMNCNYFKTVKGMKKESILIYF